MKNIIAFALVTAILTTATAYANPASLNIQCKDPSKKNDTFSCASEVRIQWNAAQKSFDVGHTDGKETYVLGSYTEETEQWADGKTRTFYSNVSYKKQTLKVLQHLELDESDSFATKFTYKRKGHTLEVIELGYFDRKPFGKGPYEYVYRNYCSYTCVVTAPKFN